MRWKPIENIVPWISLPPYFVPTSSADDLRELLHQAKFKVAVAESTGCASEKCVLDRLGDALLFPEHYGANWDAFIDCVGDMLEEEHSIAVLVVGLEGLLATDTSTFVRVVHLLAQTSIDVERVTAGASQLEFFFVGDFQRADPDPRNAPNRL